MNDPDFSLRSALGGKGLLVLNWRDIRHPQAGGAEQYMHQISRRWVEDGIDVTWFTGRGETQSPQDNIDGIHVVRGGGPLSLYPIAALKQLQYGRDFAAVVDCQNGIPFFSPLFLPRGVPVVQLVHHVHQEQFRTRFSPPMAALGRFLERHAAKSVYGQHAIAAVSPSTRLELRRLGYRGPIFVVPNGSIDVPTSVRRRNADPTITLVSRLVPHKRIDLLLGHLAAASRKFPRLKIDIIGDGPERSRLQQLSMDLGLQATVRFHGYQPDEVRDNFLSCAWLTVSTSAAEGWGCSVIEAAAWGVPCLALRVPGIRDSVIDEQTGWLVDSPAEFSTALITVLNKLSDEVFAAETSETCRDWARRFTWDRSASLLTGVLLGELSTDGHGHHLNVWRDARSDISTLARFKISPGIDLKRAFRPTDEIAEFGSTATVILNGCDEFEAAAIMSRIGIPDAELNAIGGTDLLAGPLGALALGQGPHIASGASE